MKKVVALFLVLATAAAAYWYFTLPANSSFELEDGYSALYDGESLAGWSVIGGEATFTAEGEDLVGRRGPGENTFLRTDKTYADFSLKLQMRWDELGNSGILFRSKQRESTGRAYGYQFELDHTDRAWSGGIYDEARRGWLVNLQDNEEARAAIRLDDWNDIEIEARGAQIKTWLNGVETASLIDGLDAEGFIALQVHAGETGAIRWRRIRIRELSGMTVPGADLLSAQEWRNKNVDTVTFSGNELGAALPEGDFWLSPRRQFSDSLIKFSAPACDQATTVRMRFQPEEGGSGASFSEVKIFSDRAESRLVIKGEVTQYEPVTFAAATRHDFVGVAMGKSIVMTVGERDALRLENDGVASRGQLQIQPARCGNRFAIEDFAWLSLKESNAQPLFYETLDNKPAPVLSASEALAAFRIAPDFEIELVAAEPLVEDPVAMSWDEFGRLYVVEMRGYMPDPYGTGSDEPVGQIVRLQDDDGDGVMDRSEVFLGQLVNPRAVAVVNEGVLVGVPPNLLLCELASRDAVCSQPRKIGAYGADVDTANVEHMENGLRSGLDNWLYNSKSARQLRLDNGVLSEREGLYRGQWGISHDQYGRWLYNHNSTWIQADFFAAEDLLRPGDNSRPVGLGVNLTNPPEVFSVRVNPGVNRAYLDTTLREDGRLHNATGVSGLVAYRGDQFPAEYGNDVFVPEVAGNVVAQFAMVEDGIALRAEQRLYADKQWGQRDFLASTDERFRPVDAMNGPDGALYIIDMYRGIVQDDHFLTDELREQIFQRQLEKPLGMGRIWRVRHSAGKAKSAPSELATLGSRDLVAELSSANGWRRETAQRLLLVRDENLQAALSRVAMGENTVAALHAIWTLQGRDELRTELVMAVAAGGDLQRQINALRAGHAELAAADLLLLHAQLQSAPEALRLQLALAMAGQAGNAQVRDALSELLVAGIDSAYVRQAVIAAIAGGELQFLSELLRSDGLATASAGAEAALSQLSANAYRSLRGDMTSQAVDNPALLPLLELIASRSGEAAWQQIAMLKGSATLVSETGFTPAQFKEAPPIFSDGSISEKNPLWKARLAGRVAFTWPGDELAMGIKPLSPEQLQSMSLGEAFYPQCAACHGEQGQGIDGLAPPLAGASWVTGPPEWLGRIVLQGLNGPLEVKGKSWNGVMPPHAHIEALDDATLAGLMTYLRRSWGNKADPVAAASVAAIRLDSADRETPWTAEDLQQVPYDRGFTAFVGQYTVSFITFTISEEAEGLHMSVPMYGGGLLTQISDTMFGGSAGGETVKIEFVVGDDGSVNKMILHRQGEKIPAERKGD